MHGFFLEEGGFSNFPPDANTMLLIHGNEIKDSSRNQIALTNNGVTVSSAQSRFGSMSLYFNGNSIINCNVSTSGDMTIDCWIYIDPTVSVEWPTPFCYGENDRNTVYYHAERTVTTCREEYGGSSTTQTAPAIPRGEWVHTAIVRSGSALMFFIAGKLRATISNSRIMEFKTLTIGRFIRQGNGTYFKGHIDEFRISNIARWTADFTPPTEPY